MVKEYIINSKKYDKTIDNFYVQFHYPDKTKKEGRGTIGLHRFVMNPSKGLTVDHINRNPLDNRRCNLRICTQFENNQNQKHNTSGKVGVTFNKKSNKYIAYIKVKRKHITLGEFKNFDDAVKCRLKAEEKYFPNSKVVRFDR